MSYAEDYTFGGDEAVADEQDNGGGEGEEIGGMEMEFVAKLRGLPWSATVEDVIEFFGGDCQILGDREGVHLVQTSEGRATGECFVEMLSERDLEAAVLKDHKNMGHRYVEVYKVKKVEMDWILKRTRPEEGLNTSVGPHSLQRPSGQGGAYGFAGKCETFVRLRGLPFECTKEDIAQFFSGLEIAPNGIQVVVDLNGKVTGEAYCQFTSREGAEVALTRDRECIGHRYVELFRVTNSELRTTVDQLVLRTRRQGSFASRPTPYDRPQNRGSNPNMGMGMGMGMGRQQMPMRGAPRASLTPSRYFSRANVNSGGGGDGFGGQDTWNSYANEIGSWDDGDDGGIGNMHQMQGHPPPLMPGLKTVRRMGLYPLLMRGLPWSATEVDIKNFFAPYPTRGIEIIYDETNRPSGSARALFGSEEHLNEALRKHKNRMGSRYIELFVD